MARVTRTVAGNRARTRSANVNAPYVYGSAAPQPNFTPHHSPERRTLPKAKPQAKPALSPQIRKNRRRAQSMNPGFVVYLTFAAAVMVFICVMFVRMHMQNINDAQNVAALRNQLSSLTEQNDASYYAIQGMVNLEEVRQKAVGEMGFVHVDSVRTVEYKNPNVRHISWHAGVPASGQLLR